MDSKPNFLTHDMPPTAAVRAIVQWVSYTFGHPAGQDVFDVEDSRTDESVVLAAKSGKAVFLVCRPGQGDRLADGLGGVGVDVWHPDNSDMMRYASQIVANLLDWREAARGKGDG